MTSKKNSFAFSCTSCGAKYAKWAGRCSQCSAWNAIESQTNTREKSADWIRLKDVEIGEEGERQKTSLPYLNRVVGGGLPRGTVVLLAGEPGIGKSTLLFQMMAGVKEPALYLSSEESVSQLARRFRSLADQDNEYLYLVAENRLSAIENALSGLKPRMVVVDSAQMIQCDEENFSRGGVGSLREVADRLVRFAKENQVTLWIVGHVNKEGDIAGPKTLEHLVDTVLLFSQAEDSRLRILQALKNRYGPSGELALLEMSAEGLKETEAAESFWIHQDTSKKVYGCALTSVAMGSRFLQVEIQALVVPSTFPSPRRSTSGYELSRLHLLLAVLEKRLKVPFSRFDVYLNIVGGVRISDPAADLAVAAALVSAYSEIPVPMDTIFTGEIGLTGELRPPALLEDRGHQLLSRSSWKWVTAAPGPYKGLKRVDRVETALAEFIS